MYHLFSLYHLSQTHPPPSELARPTRRRPKQDETPLTTKIKLQIQIHRTHTKPSTHPLVVKSTYHINL
jgi:hypothetical protein